MVKKNSIPERWRSLKAVGQRVPGSRFIAFKVPLKGVTNQRVTQNQKFTPKDLISTIRSQTEELGLIIDLTNTERYYTTKDLPKSVQYVKLHTAGLKIPDDATIHQFKRVVYKFLAANSDNDRLIGVHCTTGINRTGYLICRYLIDVDEWRPLHALSAFAQSRGHPIEGTVYIEDIVKGAPRSNVGIDLPPTTEETRAWNDGPDGLRDRGLLELVPGNEYADFDARDQRPLPLMRARSDEYQDNGRDFFNARPDLRGRGLPLGDMNDDLDLRKRDFPSVLPERLSAAERFRRLVDVGPDGRFNPGLENRRNFLGSDPRQLMEARDMQRPRGAPQEQMGYDDRMRGGQTAVQGFHEYQESPYQRKMDSAEYDDVEAEGSMHPLDGDLDFRARLRRQEYQSLENENQRYDPRGREMMTNLMRGPFNEKMDPRIARTLEGPMNARSAQLPGGLMNEIMHQRERRDMEGPIRERMQPRDPRFMEGSVNERFPQRDAQSSRNVMDERMQFQDVRPINGPMNERIQSRDPQFMEGPMNNRMYPRDPRQMEAATNERMQTRVSKLMDLPLNERLIPKGGPAVENSMSDRIPSRDLQSLSRLINELMTPRDARPMEGPMNARMHPRTDRAMDGSMNDPMHSREGPMSERMPQRDARAMEGLMNERMYQRDARAMQESMSDEMYPRDPRAMEGSGNERMYTQNVEYPINKPRNYVNDTRPFEGRKMNPSQDFPRGTNRFAPYPSLMKPGQPAENTRGPPRPDMRDLRDLIPPSQDATGFPPRNRFN